MTGRRQLDRGGIVAEIELVVAGWSADLNLRNRYFVRRTVVLARLVDDGLIRGARERPTSFRGISQIAAGI